MRRRSELGSVLPLLWASWLAACSSSQTAQPGQGGDGSAPPSGTAASAADFCHRYWTALASYIGRCAGGSPAEIERLFDTPLLCARFVASVQAGRTKFDATRTTACLAQAPSAMTSCDDPPSTVNVDACAQVIAPLVPAGGICKSF